MSPPRLLRLAEDPAAVPPAAYGDLALECRQHATNTLDLRYGVVAECLDLAAGFWGEGETAAVTTDFAEAVHRVWAAYLPGILRAPSPDEGTAVAIALREELAVLGQSDPLT